MPERIGDAYVRIHADTKFLKGEVRHGLENALHNVGDEEGKNFADSLSRRMEQRLGEQFKSGFLTGDFKEFARNFEDLDTALKSGHDNLRNLRDEGRLSEVQFKDLSGVLDRFGKNARLEEITTKIRDQDRAFRTYDHNVKTAVDNEKKRLEERATRWEKSVGRIGNALSKSDIGNSIGKMFGAGSRNNFFNAIGNVVGGLASLPGVIAAFPFKVAEKIGTTIDGLRDKFDALTSEGSSNIGAFFKLFGSLAAQGVAGFVLMIVVMGVVVTLVGVLTSVVSLLVAGIVGLTASISFALIGGLLALGPLLLALVPVIGGLVVALSGLNKVQKAVLAPFTSSLKKLQDQLINTFEKGAVKRLPAITKLFDGLISPLLTAGLNGFFTLIDNIMQALSTPLAKNAFSTLGASIDQIMGPLGKLFGTLTVGLVAFFNSITPYSVKLLGFLQGLADNFVKFSTSADGKTAIKDFMDKAATAGGILWDIIKNLVTAIGGLFNQGTSSGDSILTSLSGQVKNFSDWINDPANKKAIADWFTKGADFVQRLGTALQNLVGDFIALDTPENRKFAVDLIDKINETIIVLGNILPWFDDFVGAITPIVTIAEGIKVGWDQLNTSFGASPGYITPIGGAVTAMVSIAAQGLSTLLGSIALVITGFGTFLVAVGKIPGAPGWIGQLGQGLLDTGAKIDHLAAALGAINKPYSITIDAHFTQSAERAITLINSPSRRIGGAVISNVAAAGMMVTSDQLVRVGEGGRREAIVPLERPLSMIDPSVRGLAAYAQGKIGQYAGGGVVGSRGNYFAAGAITVMAPNSRPDLVAVAVLDRLAGSVV